MMKVSQPQRTPGRALAAVAAPRIRVGTSADREPVREFLTRLSRASASARFLVGVSGTPPARLLATLLPERPAGGALLGFLDGLLVGHGLWVRVGDAAVAEIAIVVADTHQRRGIGTALASAVMDDLAAHGVTDIEVVSGSTNRAVARMVARAAPDARRELDGPTTTWAFRARSQSAPLPRTA